MDIIKVLLAAFFCPTPEGRWGLPILLWSKPGIGKTALIAQIVKAFGLAGFMRMSPAEQGEGRFGVTPVPASDGLLYYPPPADVVHHFVRDGVLFVDEITTASPALQAPLLGLVQLGQLGSYKFPAHVRMIGAGNEVADAAGGWDLAPALCNRFGHIDYTGLEPADWAGALLSNFVNTVPALAVGGQALEEMVMAAWPAAYARAAGLVSGFIVRRPQLLYSEPPKGSGRKAWASNRTCHYAAVAMASAEIHKIGEINTDALMGAFVGDAWVAEFRQWVTEADLPSIEEVADGTVKFAHDERRPDRTLAVLGAFAALVIPEKAAKRVPRAQNFFRLCADLSKEVPDLIVQPTMQVLKAGLNTVSLGGSVQKIMADLLPLLKHAGMA